MPLHEGSAPARAETGLGLARGAALESDPEGGVPKAWLRFGHFQSHQGLKKTHIFVSTRRTANKSEVFTPNARAAIF